MRKRASVGRIAAAGALAAAALWVAACGRKDARGGAPEAAPVAVATVAKQDVPLDVRTIGHVDPYLTVSVKARVGGEVVRVGFREGQDVRKGDLLFQIDPRPYQAALAQAEAQLERDKAIWQKAQQDQQRYAELVQKDYVTKEQYEAARSTAAATLATSKADEAALETARLNLSYCTVTSPIEGRTGSVLVNVGNQVKGNDDKPLVVVNQIRPIYVSFSVPESSLAIIRQKARPGDQLHVTASIPGNVGSARQGDLTFMDNTVDPTTGTILLKGTFPNKDEALWPGEYVDVVLTLAVEPGSIVVPSQAVQTGQVGQFVWVVKNDLTVESRPVTVARTHGTLAIVARGLQPGERVVTDGQLRLSPGARVEIKSPGPEGKAA
jgi:multidrug efflux system membrane fusion protein